MFEFLLVVYVVGLLFISFCIQLGVDDDTIQEAIDSSYRGLPADAWRPTILQLRIGAPMSWPILIVFSLFKRNK